MEELKTPLMDWNGCRGVESVPERLHGTPVLVGTRMNADGVVENFDDGLSIAEIVEEFGLNESAVREVLSHAGRLQQQTSAA